MKKLKVYLDTSVINFVFADDAPRERDVTLKLFEQLGRYEAYVSSVVVGEIGKAPEAKRKQLVEFLSKYTISLLPRLTI